MHWEMDNLTAREFPMPNFLFAVEIIHAGNLSIECEKLFGTKNEYKIAQI